MTWALTPRNRLITPITPEKLGRAIQRGTAERGILICGSGRRRLASRQIKCREFAQALCHDVYSAHQGVEHDDMNVLVLGGRVIGPMTAIELANAYLGGEVHRRKSVTCAAWAKFIVLEERFCDKGAGS